MKRFIACLFILITTATFAADRITSLETGANKLPVSMDRFPEFRYEASASLVTLWIWFDKNVNEESYIQELRDAGFVEANGAFVKDDMQYWSHEGCLGFSLIYTDALVAPVSTVLKGFPAFEMEQFGNMYSMDVGINYSDPVPQNVTEAYIEALKFNGFKYSYEDGDYNAYADTRQYYFAIDEETYTWSILYFE